MRWFFELPFNAMVFTHSKKTKKCIKKDHDQLTNVLKKLTCIKHLNINPFIIINVEINKLKV